MKNVLAIIGPTASGKTGLALKLAQNYPIEIISMDSALVYQGMDIGTAKPSSEELQQVPHHLIDIIAPTAAYSAANFVEDTIRLVAEIQQRQKLPVIVGGTMMYYHALTSGLNELPEASAEIRAYIQHKKNTQGLVVLYRELAQVDPETASRLNPNDSQRIERAIEVNLLTGKPMSELLKQATMPSLPFKLTTIALEPEPRKKLHNLIAQRFEVMIKQGFIEEVQQLRAQYQLNAEMTAMRCVGYRQAWNYLEGLCSQEEFIEKGIIATRQLAKRQLTWLRKFNLDNSLNPFALDFEQKVNHLLNQLMLNISSSQ